MAKPSNESNLAHITVIISRQLRLLASLSDDEILARGLFKLVSEYGKITLMALREERDQLRSLAIESMSDEELYKAVRQEIVDDGNTKKLNSAKE